VKFLGRLPLTDLGRKTILVNTPQYLVILKREISIFCAWGYPGSMDFINTNHEKRERE